MSLRGGIIYPASLSRQELVRLVGSQGGEYSKVLGAPYGVRRCHMRGQRHRQRIKRGASESERTSVNDG